MLSKRVFIFTIIASMLSFSAFSQMLNRKGQFNLGFEAGPQFTNISNYNSLYQMNSKTGYSVGIFGEYLLQDEMKIRLGFYFDNRRYEKYGNIPYVSEMTDDSTGFIGYNSYYLIQVDYSLNYLTFPINFIYESGNERARVFVQVGVYYSLLLNANQNGNSILYIDPEDAPHFTNPDYTAGEHLTTYTGSVTDHFNSSDIGLNFFFGGNFRLSPKMQLTISPGFTYAFSHVFSNPEIDSRWKSIVKLNAGLIYLLDK